MTARTSRYLVVLLGALGSACVLFVHEDAPGGAHCAFAGRTTACGECLATSCAGPVDACCLDDRCGGVIADVEACAAQSTGGASDACARVESASDRGGAHADLSACAATKCHDACAENVIRCKPAYVTSVDACTCELDPTPNGTPCTAIGHPRLRCCAPEGWPGPALACDCLAILCTPIADGCLCELSGMDGNGRATECNGTHCCVDPSANQCSCRSTACYPSETPVATCTIAELGCTTGRTRVDTCSVPKTP